MNEPYQQTAAAPTVATEADAMHTQLSRLVDEGVGLGKLWASHGLTLGRLALETSARTLSVTATVLGDLSKNFSSRDEQ